MMARKKACSCSVQILLKNVFNLQLVEATDLEPIDQRDD
jgi:hypothetical protein